MEKKLEDLLDKLLAKIEKENGSKEGINLNPVIDTINNYRKSGKTKEGKDDLLNALESLESKYPEVTEIINNLSSLLSGMGI